MPEACDSPVKSFHRPLRPSPRYRSFGRETARRFPRMSCPKPLTEARVNARMGRFSPANAAATEALRCSAARSDCTTRAHCGEEARAILALHQRALQSRIS